MPTLPTPPSPNEKKVTDLQSEAVFRRLVEGVLDYAIFLLNPEGFIATWNAGAELIKGYRPDEIIGQHFSKFYPEEALAVQWPAIELQRATETGRLEDEGWRIRKDGSRFWANVVITALRDAHGELIGFTKITRDLTERRGHEERLRQSEENLRSLVEGVKDYAIYRLEADGTVASWNLGAQRIKGYAADEIIGKHFSVFYRPEDIERQWPQHELEAAARLGRFEDEGWRVLKDGSLIWANVVITAIYDDEKRVRGFSKITRDLTERRRQEERLKRSEENLRLLVEGIKDHAFFMSDAEGVVTSWNAGAERLFGFPMDEALGQNVSLLCTPEDLALHWPQDAIHAAQQRGSLAELGWRVRRDGSRFFADVSVTALTDPQGVPRGFAHMVRDMTERQRVQQLEIEGQRMTEFIAMLAHELRNPLAPIANAVGILDKLDTSPQLQWCTRLIERQVLHFSRLVDDLLDVSRITSGKIQLRNEPLELGALLSQALESVQPTVARMGHRLEVERPEEPLRVLADPARLTQVIVNLMNNSAKYTPDGGLIRVKLAREGAEASLVIADNGIGMTQELTERVFDLFVQGPRTLERAEGGLGIGLTLVKRIVQLHGGTVAAFSAGPGQGTQMVVSLPLQINPADPQHSPSLTPSVPAPEERRILVVDDNIDAAMSLATLLRLSGHEVVLAHDGPVALQLVLEQLPDAVLLDLGLPGMDGYEVARQIRRQPALAQIRIIAMTGYGREDDRRSTAAAGFDAHLVKPVDYDEVLNALAGKGPVGLDAVNGGVRRP